MKKWHETKWHHIYRPSVTKLLLWQLILAMILAFSFLWVDLVATYSAILGVLIFLIPNLFFVRSAFADSTAGDVHQIVRSFYKGEITKLLLTALLFGAVFIGIHPLNIFALFIAFVIALLANAVLLLFHDRKRIERPRNS